MKKISLITTAFLCAYAAILAQDEALDPSADLLFKNVKSITTSSEKNEIFKLTDFALAPNGAQFYFGSNPDQVDFPFDVYVYPLDLNSDGIEEIALIYGNMMTSGHAGSSASLYIKNAEGQYQAYFGFPGSIEFLPTADATYPDVLIGGPGFEFPVWRWDGSTYSMHKKISNDELTQLEVVFLAQASQTYTDSLSKE